MHSAPQHSEPREQAAGLRRERAATACHGLHDAAVGVRRQAVAHGSRGGWWELKFGSYSLAVRWGRRCIFNAEFWF
jgi:hypothetical protein